MWEKILQIKHIFFCCICPILSVTSILCANNQDATYNNMIQYFSVSQE